MNSFHVGALRRRINDEGFRLKGQREKRDKILLSIPVVAIGEAMEIGKRSSGISYLVVKGADREIAAVVLGGYVTPSLFS